MNKWLHRRIQSLWNFLYNGDRACASLAGAPPEETISSEIGRHKDSNPMAKAAASVLDHVQQDHVENAMAHAASLDKADSAYYADGGKGK